MPLVPDIRYNQSAPGNFVVSFGGGRNTRVRPIDLDISEDAGGINYDLDARGSFRRRKPFDLVATAPNTAAIRGYAQLVRRDGTLSTLIQAGGTVYSWDGGTGFTSVGTVNTSSRLRGKREANFLLDDEVIITDLAKLTSVKTWNGTTFQDLAHNLGGSFYAKYCFVDLERALFANVTSGTDTPHLVVGSKRGEKETLSVTNRPSSALSEEDAFFLPLPNLKPINGFVGALGVIIVSTTEQLHVLTGASAQDFMLDDYYFGSGAAGDEAICSIGNDILFGRVGVIESLIDTDRSGDVDTNDVSFLIQPDVENVTSWTLCYDQRQQKAYCIPAGGNRLFMLRKSLIGSGVSPWALWETDHPFSFQTTAVMGMKRPSDGLDAVYLGGPNGEIFQLDGTGDQDGGTADITASRVTGMVRIPAGLAGDFRGLISHSRQLGITANITMRYQGREPYDQTITKVLPGAPLSPVYGTTAHYGTKHYYGSKTRTGLEHFEIAGNTEQFQIELSITGSDDFDIQDLEIDFGQAPAQAP